MRAARLLSMLITLQLRGRVTAADLAERFEVSKRTIYRDADALSAAGVPIYADRGPGGGFALLDGYRTRLTGMTAAEAEAMLLMGLPGPLEDLGLAEPASAARLKLLASLPAGAGDSAARVADRFHLDPVDWYRRASSPPLLAAVASCVWEQRRLDVRYESWKGESRRTLEPLGLVMKAGRWYLAARAGGKDVRTYRVSQILEAAPLETRFERPAGYDLARWWAEQVARFEASLSRGTATLLVRPSALPMIDQLGADAAESVRAAPADEQGCRQAVVPIEGLAHAAALLLGFKDQVEVLAPEALREEMRRSAQRIGALYAPRHPVQDRPERP
ncbi:YafY family protein [Sphingosinicella sp. CPCC 101087]|uniref:helix-turn-helix transcriptional regulator n=1 Tax=Sphingosinicella sp. CPCC 101087 TaxID=2497754 RepID=UPI00101C6802|nr:YafY family protein [Sphingosinicella sp. CPCC 101087]